MSEAGGGGQGRVVLDCPEQALANHLVSIARWATQISFRALRQSRTLQQIFIDLDLEMGSSPTREKSRGSGRHRISALLKLDRNLVILGDPGAGKSTSLQRLAHGVLSQGGEPGQAARVPLLVFLKELHGRTTLAESILESVGVKIYFDESVGRMERERVSLLILLRTLNLLGAVVLLDGLDEMHPDKRKHVGNELRQLLRCSDDYRVVVTCRTADFTRLENAEVYTIEPLSDSQIEALAQNWLGPESARDLLKRVRDAPYGGSEVLPLTLAHLCAIYEKTGTVPKKPKTIYGMIVRLLLNEWDWEREVQRVSAFSDFHVDRKEEFLRALAYELTTRLSRHSFDFIQIDRAYRAICKEFHLVDSDCRRVLQEIESHTGLILRSSFDRFDFAHKTLQEYLAAEYILRLSSFPEALVIKAPYEMALVVSMSTDAAGYFMLIVKAALKFLEGSPDKFVFTFLRRLSLERVEFKPSQLLGQCIVELFAFTFFPMGAQVQLKIQFGMSSTVFRDFFRLEGVRQSVLQALQGAEVESCGGEIFRLRWRNSEEPHTTSAEARWIVVDAGFFQQAGFSVKPG